jgi:hypothetical protein
MDVNKRSIHVFIFACFAVALGAAAQDAGNMMGMGAARGGGQGMMGQRGGRVRENLATLRLLRLTQALDLSQDQTSRIFPFINKIDMEKIRIQRQMSADIQELRRIINRPAASEDEIAPLIGKIKAAQERVKKLDAESEAFLEKNLNPVQQGKYVLFQIDFYRMLEQAVADLRPQRGAAPEPIKK